VVVILACYFLPWKNINWGKISTVQPELVTVSGEAKTVVKNQLASFSVGVNAVNDNKEAAVGEVNSKMAAVIKSVKDFGIKEADIVTQNMSVYQNRNYYMEDGVQKMRKGQWSASNSVEITVREVSKVQELADLLNTSSANNVYGPNFRLDDTNAIELGLYDAAMKDARAKAEAIARASGRNLGKVMIVNDNGVSQNYLSFPISGGGIATDKVAAPVEIGSQTVTKNITVSFELE